MNAFKPGEAPAALQFLTKPGAQLSNKFHELVAERVRWCLKLAGQNAESVVHQLQMFSGLTIQKTPLQKASVAPPRAWRLSPVPVREPWPPVGEASCGTLLLLCSWLRASCRLKTGQVRLRGRPSGHEFFRSSKIFLWPNFVPWACRPQRNRICLLYVWWLFPLKRGCL